MRRDREQVDQADQADQLRVCGKCDNKFQVPPSQWSTLALICPAVGGLWPTARWR